ncbi:hypothetical protein RHSIM_Rhsim11G0044000 [Rhododendron simsii]|uniref:DUF4408 domain-containing protein n=1 Tax=Rhododendron simsii TaxID=118357 RepID=A0A834G9F7_RHOSS|nr:hypothetical protein RHSIM_Rhsim11G0044000 [Rhododendron simsii]
MFEDSVSSFPSIWASMNSWFTPTVFFVLLNVVIGTIAITSTFSNQKHHPKPQNDDAQPHTRLTRSPSVLQRLRSFNFHTGYPSQDPLNRIPDSHTHFAPQQKYQEAPDSDEHVAPEQKIEQQTQKFFQHTHFDHIPDSGTHYASEQNTQTRNLYQQIPDPDTHFAPEQTIRETQKFFQQTHFDPTEDVDTHYAREEARRDEGEDSPSIDEVYSKLRARHVNRTNSDTKPSGGEMPERLAAKMRKSASAKSAFSHFEENDFVEARRPATVREGSSRATEEDDEEVDSKADDFINKFKQQLKLQRLDSIVRYKDLISRGGGK